MNVFVSYVHNSEDDNYKKKVVEIKSKLQTHFNVLESARIEEVESRNRGSKRLKLNKDSTEQQIKISFCIICCINYEYIDNDIMSTLMKITKKKLPKVKIIVDEKFNADLVHQHSQLNGDVVRLFKPSDMDEIMSILLTKACIKASTEGDLVSIKSLISKGVDLNRRDTLDGSIPINHAFKGNYETKTTFSTLKCLVKNGADINATNSDGQTPLHLAINSKAVVEFLISKGANVNKKCSVGRTPLHYAIFKKNRLGIIEYLCKKGASLTEKDEYDETPLDLAISCNNLETLLYFYNNYPILFKYKKYAILDSAISVGSVRTIKLLYKSGLDIHHKDDMGYTALHKAAELCNDEIYKMEKVVKYLCKKNISINEKNNEGKTALDLAFQSGTIKAFEYLFTKQLLDNDFSVTFFLDEFKLNYLIKPKDKEQDRENLSVNKLNLINVLLDWYETRTRSENRIMNKGIYDDIFDDQCLCNLETNETHLKMCFIKLKCEHNVCAKCFIKMLLNTAIVNCGTCNKCHVIKIEQISKSISTIWSLENANALNIGTKSLKLFQTGIDSITQVKEKINGDLIKSYMDAIEYYEDCLDVRMESIKMEIDNLKEKLIERVDLRKEYFKTSGTVEPLQLIRRFEGLWYHKSEKMISMSHFGMIKLKPAFIDNGNKINEKAQTIEKGLYNELIHTKTISKSTTKEIKSTIQTIEKLKGTKESVAFKLKMLKDTETYMIPQIFDANISIKNINKPLEHTMYSDMESTQSSIEEIIMDDHDADNRDYSEYSESDDENSLYIKNLSTEKRNQVFKTTIKEYNHDFNKTLTKIDNSTSNLTEMFDDIDTLRYTRSKLTEYEIKAFQLIRMGNFEEFKLFMEQNKVKLEAQHYRDILLFEAIHYEMFEFVEFFLEKGANFNYVDKYGRNALHKAALENKKDDIIELLMKKSCPILSDQLKVVLLNNTDKLKYMDLEIPDQFGCNVFHYICARGKDSLLDELKPSTIKKIFCLVKDTSGMSYLDRIAANGHINILNKINNSWNRLKLEVNHMLFQAWEKSDNMSDIELLFNKLESSEIYIPEMLLKTGGNSDVIIKKIEFLLSKDAKLRYCVYFKNEILRHLMLSRSCKYVDEKLFSYFLTKGLDTLHRDELEKSIAHYAAKYGYLHILKALDGVLPLNETDINGFTPLYYGVRFGHLDIVKWYLKQNDATELLQNNNSIFDLAFSFGFTEISKVLKSYGIESNFKNYFRLNVEIQHDKPVIEIHPIYLNGFAKNLYTIEFKYFIIRCFKYVKLETILEYGIQIDKYSDNFGANALHLAALFGRNDIILWLYAKHFALHSIDKLGFTALAYAAFNRQIHTSVLFKILGLNDIYLENKPFLNYYLTCSVKFKESNQDTVNLFCASIRFTLEKAGKIIKNMREKNNLTVIKSICGKMSQ